LTSDNRTGFSLHGNTRSVMHANTPWCTLHR